MNHNWISIPSLFLGVAVMCLFTVIVTGIEYDTRDWGHNTAFYVSINVFWISCIVVYFTSK